MFLFFLWFLLFFRIVPVFVSVFVSVSVSVCGGERGAERDRGEIARFKTSHPRFSSGPDWLVGSPLSQERKKKKEKECGVMEKRKVWVKQGTPKRDALILFSRRESSLHHFRELNTDCMWIKTRLTQMSYVEYM